QVFLEDSLLIRRLLVKSLLGIDFHVLKFTAANMAPMIAITTNTGRQPRKCSNSVPNGAPAQRAVKCPETTIESHFPLRFGGAISPMIAYIKGVIEATDKPAKIRITISHKNEEAKAVSALEIAKNNKPNVIIVLRPFLSESQPKNGAEKAYVTAKTVPSIQSSLD